MAGRKKTAPETVEAEVVNEVAVTQPAKMEFRLINPTEDGFLRVIKRIGFELPRMKVRTALGDICQFSAA